MGTWIFIVLFLMPLAYLKYCKILVNHPPPGASESFPVKLLVHSPL